MTEGPGQPNWKWDIPDEVVGGVWASVVRSHPAGHTVVLDFAAADDRAQNPTLRVVSRVRLDIAAVQSLLETLSGQLNEIEGFSD